MDILVTGGAGFIGSNFVRTTLETRPDDRVVVLDAMTYAANLLNLEGLNEAYPGRLNFVKGSITDHDVVRDAMRGCGLVVHFAAESHNDRSLTDPLCFVRTNVMGTATLLEEATRIGAHFHHISTDEVFGDLPLGSGDAFTLESPYRPSSPYSASKAASDHLVRAWVRSKGLDATITNCSNNYGPRQHPEKFIPRQITGLLTGQAPRVYGAGRNVRDWIHVDDHNAAVWLAIERGQVGHTYLIGVHGERSNLEVARELCALFSRPESDIVFVTDRPGHDLRYAIDPTSINALGFEPCHKDFREGLYQTVAWYRDNPSFWRDSRRAAEQTYAKTEKPAGPDTLK